MQQRSLLPPSNRLASGASPYMWWCSSIQITDMERGRDMSRLQSDSKDGRSTLSNAAMTRKALAIKAHAEAIAALLYEEADPEQLTTLAGWKTVQLLEHVTPYWCFFLSAQPHRNRQGRPASKSILGELPISSKQTKLLVAPHQISPYLETCCVRSSANVSYENAAKDVEFSRVYEWVLKHSSSPPARVFPTILTNVVEQLSVDGRKVRLGHLWANLYLADYKAVRLHGQQKQLQDNAWLVGKSSTTRITTHLYRWWSWWHLNIITQLAPAEQRRNPRLVSSEWKSVYKVGGS